MPRPSFRFGALALVTLSLLGLLTQSAWAQVCGTLPAPLIAMCPDAPARASEVNDNFRTVANWFTAKLGPLPECDAGSCAPSGVVASSLTAPSATVSSATVGALTVTGRLSADGGVWVGRRVVDCPSQDFCRCQPSEVAIAGGADCILPGVDFGRLSSSAPDLTEPNTWRVRCTDLAGAVRVPARTVVTCVRLQ